MNIHIIIIIADSSSITAHTIIIICSNSSATMNFALSGIVIMLMLSLLLFLNICSLHCGSTSLIDNCRTDTQQ